MNKLEQVLQETRRVAGCKSHGALAIQWATKCKECFGLMMVPALTLLGKEVHEKGLLEKAVKACIESLKLIPQEDAKKKGYPRWEHMEWEEWSHPAHSLEMAKAALKGEVWPKPTQ